MRNVQNALISNTIGR